MALLSTGCSEESSTTEEPLPPEEILLSESIIGNWTWESFKVDCDEPQYNIPLLKVDEANCITIEESVTCNFRATFTADKMATFSITRDGDTNTANLTYSVDDDKNSFDLCFQDGSEEVCQTYQVNDDSFDYIEDEGDCVGTYVFIKS